MHTIMDFEEIKYSYYDVDNISNASLELNCKVEKCFQIPPERWNNFAPFISSDAPGRLFS